MSYHLGVDVQGLNRKLDRFEELLALIEQNGRSAPEEKFFIWRKDLDGKLITLRIRCNIRSVGDINIVDQHFSVKMWFSACWFEPLISPYQDRETVDWEKAWDPRLSFENAVSVNIKSKKHYLHYFPDLSPHPEVTLSVHMEGTFKELMELHDFPFDSQELNVVIGTDWGANDVVFEKDLRIKDSINVFNFSGNQSYTLRPHLLATSRQLEKDSSGSHKKYNCHIVTFHVTRHVGYYFWNVFFVTGVIMLLTFCSLAVPPDEPGDRLGVTVTLLLTSVAFKYAVSQTLPLISYLTLLDLYVLACLILQSVFLVQNSVAVIVQDGRTFDLYSGLVLAAVVAIFHIVFILVIAIKIHKRNKILSGHTKRYDRLCHDINEEYHKRKQRLVAAEKKAADSNTAQKEGDGKTEPSAEKESVRVGTQEFRFVNPHATSQEDSGQNAGTDDLEMELRNRKPVSASGAVVEVLSSSDDGGSAAEKLLSEPKSRDTWEQFTEDGAGARLPTDQNKRFEALRDYTGEPGDSEVLNFKSGEILTVNMLKLRKDGWVMAENRRGQTGLVPSTYLKPASGLTQVQTR